MIPQQVADNNEHLFLVRVVADRPEFILFYLGCAQLGSVCSTYLSPFLDRWLFEIRSSHGERGERRRTSPTRQAYFKLPFKSYPLIPWASLTAKPKIKGTV